jgi:hypothetical protein
MNPRLDSLFPIGLLPTLYENIEANLHKLDQDLPLARNAPERRGLERFTLAGGVAELAGFIEATSQQIMKQTSTRMFQLRNNRCRFRNRLVKRIQNGGSADLLWQIW